MRTCYLFHNELGVCVIIKHFAVFRRLHISIFHNPLVTHLGASYQIWKHFSMALEVQTSCLVAFSLPIETLLGSAHLFIILSPIGLHCISAPPVY